MSLRALLRWLAVLLLVVGSSGAWAYVCPAGKVCISATWATFNPTATANAYGYTQGILNSICCATGGGNLTSVKRSYNVTMSTPGNPSKGSSTIAAPGYGTCPTATTGQVYEGSDAYCVLPATSACTAGQVASSGYYDVGTSQGNSPVILACTGSCETIFDGTSPAGSALVGGVKHWYAQGSYSTTGNTCTVGSSNAGPDVSTVAEASLPASTCGAGQVLGTVNGVPTCAAGGAGTGQPSTPTDATVTATQTSSVTNADGSVTKTVVTTITYPDGSKETSTTTTTTNTDGSQSSTTTQTGCAGGGGNGTGGCPGSTSSGGSSGSGSGSGSGTGTGTDPSQTDQPCTANPSAAGCGGTAAAVTSGYAAKSDTMAGVLGAARDTVLASPAGSAMASFFTVSGGGGCPTWSASVPMLGTLTINQLCSEWAGTALLGLRTALLLVASFFAFRVAFE